LTEAESGELVERFQTLEADRLPDVAPELSPEALIVWLHDPSAR
jgi:hypothetical protein